MGKALNALQVKHLDQPGRYSDGDGLYLTVSPKGAKSWLFMWKVAGKRREMGLGSARLVSLSEARQLADEARRWVRQGKDPIAERERERKPPPSTPTFREVANELLEHLEPSFRNEKHRAQWRSTLTTYAAPLLDMQVDQIGAEDVLAVLKPIWRTKNETASRLRGRIERVLDAAAARGLRVGDNPARWRGRLDKLLPPRRKLSRGHHKAMPYVEVPAFVARLRATKAITAQALEFLILTAARSGEVLNMVWDEVDFDAAIWTVPGARMKAGRPHRVPLSPRAVEILRALQATRVSDFVFPGAKKGRPLSNMAPAVLMKRMGVDATVHGFRSAFRDWCGEETDFAREIAEAALAHVVGDATERAYRRGDALEKRRLVMDAWGLFLR